MRMIHVMEAGEYVSVAAPEWWPDAAFWAARSMTHPAFHRSKLAPLPMPLSLAFVRLAEAVFEAWLPEGD